MGVFKCIDSAGVVVALLRHRNIDKVNTASESSGTSYCVNNLNGKEMATLIDVLYQREENCNYRSVRHDHLVVVAADVRRSGGRGPSYKSLCSLAK